MIPLIMQRPRQSQPKWASIATPSPSCRKTNVPIRRKLLAYGTSRDCDIHARAVVSALPERWYRISSRLLFGAMGMGFSGSRRLKHRARPPPIGAQLGWRNSVTLLPCQSLMRAQSPSVRSSSSRTFAAVTPGQGREATRWTCCSSTVGLQPLRWKSLSVEVQDSASSWPKASMPGTGGGDAGAAIRPLEALAAFQSASSQRTGWA
mmetsp:Transcript_3565/g.10923  ORF Transcript_3565/g.10923 Transcript_3565/m.10923 type:complete len:206 (-) Transcript_3565:300-917(-)